MASKKKNFVDRSVRGARAAKKFVDSTRERFQVAVGKVDSVPGYKIDDLLSDAMEQWNDTLDALWPSTASSEVPVVYFISNGSLPLDQSVGLSESVQAGLINSLELMGLGKSGTTAAPALIQNTAATGYSILDPDTGNTIGGGDTQELDEVVVHIKSMPANSGIYRAALYLGHDKVLAEIVVVRV